MNFDQVLERVAEDSKGKVDFLTPVNNLRTDPKTGHLVFLNRQMVQGEGDCDFPFATTEWAENQLTAKLGMPGQYFRKARNEDPELFAQHFNYWAQKAEGVMRLRTKIRGGQGIVRGAVSDKYTPLDNDVAIDTLRKILKGNEAGYTIEAFHLDDRRMHLRMTYNDLSADLGILPNGDKDINRLGSDLVNSEVGASSLNLRAIVWRLICSNGLRGWGQGEGSLIQRHIHLRAGELHDRLANAMVNQLNTGQEFLEQFRAAREQEIQNPFAVIAKLAQEGNFSQKFIDNAKAEWEGDKTAYGVINAFTRASRELPNEHRLSAESFAGRLVQFPARKWEQLDVEEAV